MPVIRKRLNSRLSVFDKLRDIAKRSKEEMAKCKEEIAKCMEEIEKRKEEIAKRKRRLQTRLGKDHQKSTSQDSACVLQDASTSSPETSKSSPETSTSSPEPSTSSPETSTLSPEIPTSSPETSTSSPETSTSYPETSQHSFLGSLSMSSQDELSPPRNKVPRSESCLEEKLRSLKPIGGLTPEQIIEDELDEGGLDYNMFVNHFRRQVSWEFYSMAATCKTWDEVFAQTILPEPIQELVLEALGQARQIMEHPLKQFARYVRYCARHTPETSQVSPADLRAYWDTVFIQVVDVNMRFEHLEELRKNDWVEDQKRSGKKVVAKNAAMKKLVKASNGTTRIREIITAARKAKKDRESQAENSGQVTSYKSPPTPSRKRITL